MNYAELLRRLEAVDEAIEDLAEPQGDGEAVLRMDLANAIAAASRIARALAADEEGDTRMKTVDETTPKVKFNQQNFEIPQVCLDLGFEDQSWRNDGAAFMIHTRLKLGLWVCEEKPKDREHFSMKRFTVVDVDEDFTPVMKTLNDGSREEVELLETESEEELRSFIRRAHDSLIN